MAQALGRLASPRLLLSTTAYGGVAGDGRLGLDRLSHRLPLVASLEPAATRGPPPGAAQPRGPPAAAGEGSEQSQQPRRTRRLVQIDAFLESDWAEGMELMNQVIREGRSWPFEFEFESLDAYRAYFLSHAALCVKDYRPASSEGGGREDEAEGAATEGSSIDGSGSRLLGCFYIKPNFPGRCGHVCNGGFVTAPRARGRGVGRLMGRAYLRFARDLGYKSSYFNLVFASNGSSVRLWEDLGFRRVAELPGAARLRGLEGLDTAYGYHYDLESLPDDSLSPYVVAPPPEPPFE